MRRIRKGIYSVKKGGMCEVGRRVFAEVLVGEMEDGGVRRKGCSGGGRKGGVDTCSHVHAHTYRQRIREREIRKGRQMKER